LRSELDATGFRLSFEQTLMGLDLEGWRPTAEPAAAVATEVELQSVACDTADWADLASRSFGYPVPAAVTERLVQKPGVRMFIARQHGQPVGTGLIYARGKSAGIHMVGVVPEARRLGIARGIMMRLLNDVRARGFCVATLQASHMGERLYRELGFRPQGRIHNFQLR
jgi:ribosomal protein S18 acetylase RimI-like enzyme